MFLFTLQFLKGCGTEVSNAFQFKTTGKKFKMGLDLFSKNKCKFVVAFFNFLVLYNKLTFLRLS